MKNSLFFILIFLSIVAWSQNQSNDISFSYGGSFTGFGDLQGKFISIAYNHKLYKRLYLYGDVAQSSMSGLASFKFHPEKNILGADGIHWPLF